MFSLNIVSRFADGRDDVMLNARGIFFHSAMGLQTMLTW